jgi:hypothetical protein
VNSHYPLPRFWMIYRGIWINTIKDLGAFHGGSLGEVGSHWYRGIQLGLSMVICEFHFSPSACLSSNFTSRDRADDSVQKFLNMDIATGGIGEKVLKGGSVHEQVTRFGVDGKAEAASKGDVARVLEAAAGFH